MTEKHSSKPEEPVAGPSKSSEWPTLPATQKETSLPVSSIPLRQKTPVSSVVPVSLPTKKKSPEDHEKYRVGNYAPYFKENAILPILELVAETVLKILSFIVTDKRTRRLSGLTKETFGEFLGKAEIPGRYYCRGSFAT